MEIITKTEQETIQAAQNLASKIQPGDIITLQGNLGAGKTVFARALIQTLMKDTALEVPSPTFTLVQTYDTEKNTIWHFDLYRLKDSEEIYELGWEEAISEGITVIEWPERLGNLYPPQYLDIRLTNIDNNPEHRKIEITRVE